MKFLLPAKIFYTVVGITATSIISIGSQSVWAATTKAQIAAPCSTQKSETWNQILCQIPNRGSNHSSIVVSKNIAVDFFQATYENQPLLYVRIINSLHPSVANSFYFTAARPPEGTPLLRHLAAVQTMLGLYITGNEESISIQLLYLDDLGRVQSITLFAAN